MILHFKRNSLDLRQRKHIFLQIVFLQTIQHIIWFGIIVIDVKVIAFQCLDVLL